MNVLDLFSGIGGFSLGLERAGMRTVAFCEIDPFCRRVLAKHWPGVPIYDDVRELTAERLRADGIYVDLICGGFPCQDISFAGKGAGLAGERSGLWSEYARLVGELRPKFVFVENVAALLSRGLGDVLGDLAAIGYDAEWHCIPASAVGAPHQRDRVWVVAYPMCSGGRVQQVSESERKDSPDANHDGAQEPLANSSGKRRRETRELRRYAKWTAGRGEALGDASSKRLEGPRHEQEASCGKITRQLVLASEDVGRQWVTEPDVGRVANGVPSRVDRLRSLGNAVVPQIPEIIGRAIMNARTPNEQKVRGYVPAAISKRK